MHAESVLLVDDHEAEIAEHDILLEDRMRADENVDASLFQRVDDLRALAAALAPGEERDAQARRSAEVADGLEMLARQELGRRHQRRLRARFHGGGHGQQRHHGLAAADIALEQAKHAVGAFKVGIDLGQRASLRAGQLEGEGGRESALRSLPVAASRRPARRLSRARITASASWLARSSS